LLFSRLNSQFRSNWINNHDLFVLLLFLSLLFVLIGIYYTLRLLDYLVGIEFPTSNVKS